MDPAQQFAKAVELFQTGDLAGAEHALAPLGGAGSDHPDVLHLSAVLLLEQGQPEKAARCFERLADTEKGGPLPPEILRPMAVAYQRAGEFGTAAKIAGDIVAAAPAALDDRLNHAFMLLEAEQFQEALEAFEAALRMDANCADAHFGRGRAALAIGRLGEADQSFAEALRLSPSDAEAIFWHARALHALGDSVAATERLRRAVQIFPDFPEAHCDLGKLLADAGDIDNAMRAYEQALRCDPVSAEAHNGLGTLQSALGRRAEAERSFRTALKTDPNLIIAHCNIAELKRFSFMDADAGALMAQSERTDLGEADRVQLGFALGKMYEDIGDYDAAFAAFSAANRLHRAGLAYDPGEEDALAAAMIEAFAPAAAAKMADAGAGVEDATPIFVLGMPRSATSLVEQTLASHPMVYGAGELDHFETLLRKKAPEIKDLAELDARALTELGSAYVDALRKSAPAGAAHVVDKMPTNFLFLGPIALSLPQAKLIHCVRDPVDTCLSCYKRLFSHRHPYSYDLAELGGFYTLYQRLMAHWQKVFPDRIVDVVYEDLVADPEGETRRLIAACGLDWDAACLAFHETERPVLTNPEGVRRPIYGDAVARWRHYEAHLAPLLDALNETTDG